ncbi:MAG: oligosaccharide flippase family protein, partial [Candidatus Odinarchaeota archaeon]
MSKKPGTISSARWILVSTTTGSLLGLIFIILIGNLSTYEDIAVLGFITVLFTFFNHFTRFGLKDYLVMRIPKLNKGTQVERLQAASSIQIILIVFLLTNFGIFLLIFTLSGFFPVLFLDFTQSRNTLQLISISLFFMLFNDDLGVVLQSLSLFRRLAAKDLFTRSVKTVIAIIIYFFSRDINQLIQVFIIGDTIGVFLSMFWIRKVSLSDWRNIKLLTVKEIFKSAFPFYVSTLLIYVEIRIDSLLVMIFLSTEFFAIYYLIKQLFQFFETVTISIYTVLLTKMSEAVKIGGKDQLRKFYHVAYDYFMLFAFLLAFISSSYVFPITDAFGKSIPREFAFIYLIMFLALIPRSIWLLELSVLYAIEKTRYLPV